MNNSDNFIEKFIDETTLISILEKAINVAQLENDCISTLKNHFSPTKKSEIYQSTCIKIINLLKCIVEDIPLLNELKE